MQQVCIVERGTQTGPQTCLNGNQIQKYLRVNRVDLIYNLEYLEFGFFFILSTKVSLCTYPKMITHNIKKSACSEVDPGSIPGSVGQENPLENGTATHSSIPAWRIPWTKVQSIGLQRPTVISCNEAKVLFKWISIICSTDNNWYESYVSLLIDPFYCHWNSQVFWCCHLWTWPLAISDSYKKNINNHSLIIPRYQNEIDSPTYCDSVVHYNCNNIVPFSWYIFFCSSANCFNVFHWKR